MVVFGSADRERWICDSQRAPLASMR